MKAVLKIKCGLANTACNPAVSKCYFQFKPNSIELLSANPIN